MSIRANDVLQQRQVQLRRNYHKQFSHNYGWSGFASALIRNNEKVYWYPYWGAFYYMTYGHLILHIDLGFSTADADVVNPSLDPCQSTQPIFKCTGRTDAQCYKRINYDLTGTIGTSTQRRYTIVDHVWVYKMMYACVNGDNTSSKQYYNGIIKISGNPRASGSTGTLTIDYNYFKPYWGMDNIKIMSIIGLEQYGFFLSTYDTATSTRTVTLYELYMAPDPNSSTGELLKDSNNYDFVETVGTVNGVTYPAGTVKTFTPDTTQEQRLMQQGSYMYQNKPIYAVAGKSGDPTYRNKIYEYTSNIQTPELFDVSETAQNGDARSIDFYNYNVTMQQFHLFTVMPGDLADDIGDINAIDYDKIKVSIVDLTSDYQDEVMRWDLGQCGDAFYNSSTYSFEQCDRAAQPPRNAYKYPSASNWVRKDIWFDDVTGEYYTCSDICLQQPVSLCGDGWESNNPYD